MLPSHNCIIITMFSLQGASSSKLTAHVPHSSRHLLASVLNAQMRVASPLKSKPASLGF